MSWLFTKSSDRKRVLASFAYGYVAAIPALAIEMTLPDFALAEPAFNLAARSYLVSGLVEEAIKFFLIIFILRRFRTDEGRTNPATFGAVAALGFATLENVLVGDRTVPILLLRSATAVPLHVSLAIVMVWGLRPIVRPTYSRILLTLMIATAAHGTYDLLLSIRGPISIVSLGIVIVLAVVSIALIRKLRFEGNRT